MNHSYRNEAVYLRALLRSSCLLLEQYSIETPRPLSRWWESQKFLAQIRKKTGLPVGPRTAGKLKSRIGPLMRNLKSELVDIDLDTLGDILESWNHKGKDIRP